MPEYRKEWFKKAQIDYFAPFVNLWLSCNAWYMDHYSELGQKDRDHINKLKTDFSTRNHLYIRFKNLLKMVGKRVVRLEQILSSYILHYLKLV